MTVFDEHASKATQVRYILQSDAAAELVFDWWPKGVYAICARLVNNPSLLKAAELAWDDFREALELLAETQEADAIEDQVVKKLVAIAGQLTQGGRMPFWASAIMRETCGLLYGAIVWQLGAKRFDGIDFEALVAKDKDSLMTLTKNVRKLLEAEIKHNGAPVWLLDLEEKKREWRNCQRSSKKKGSEDSSAPAHVALATSGAVSPATGGAAATSGADSGATKGTTSTLPYMYFWRLQKDTSTLP